ncbi:MAG: sensor histidine kinase, partial [Candidatus Woesearchaeota archaeon]
ELHHTLIDRIIDSNKDFKMDLAKDYVFSDPRLMQSKYIHIFKLAEGGGAFMFGSDKRNLLYQEYQFVRVIVDHAAFGLQSRRLLRKISTFAETIDVLEYTYQRIVDNLPLGVVGIDTNNRVALWNDLMENMFGIKETEILQKFITDIFVTEENKANISEFIDSIHSKKDIQEVEELQYTARDGTQKVFLVLGYQLRDEHRRINGTILVFRDITENFKFEEKLKRAREIKERELTQKVKAATQELQSANVELQKLNSLKSEFVSLVSHKLRTPLTSIRGYASLLLTNKLGDLSEKQYDSIKVIKEEGERLSALINDLLDLSRLEAGKTSLHLQKVNVSELVNSVVTSVEVQAKPKNIELQIRGRKKLEVNVDKDKISQVLYNIIGNAIKFTPENGHIQVKIEEKKSVAILSVKDDGIGISKKDQQTLFEPFAQVESHLKRSSPGSGLGLTISKHIVELHQGEIKIDSKLKKGSTFSIILPKNLEEQ